ncbi:P27 family phage terminase small subunit [Microbacterium sp.]|uniref:P27 family phage terminase small subunit n=1 Tax=Microbacterium sp. TaxID=51671 RepID=UPI0037C9812F
MTADRYDGLPEEWSLSARETYAAISEDNPKATAAQLAALYEACALLALADALADTIPEHGLMTTGSQGQTVVNPAIAEVRALRRDALAALRGLSLTTDRSATSASRAAGALAARRWQR